MSPFVKVRDGISNGVAGDIVRYFVYIISVIFGVGL